MRTGQISGKNPCRKTKFGVIGACQNLVFGVKIKHRHHRAENLLAGDGHVIGDIGKDGGLQKIPRPVHAVAPRDQARALGFAFRDKAFDDLALAL